MPPKKLNGTQRLLILSHSLEDAIGRNAWTEVQELLDQRASELERLEASPELIDLSVIEAVRTSEARALKFLETRRGAVLAEIRNTRSNVKVFKAYAGRPKNRLDQAG